MDGKVREWDRHQHLIGMAIRSNVNRSTDFTPNFMMLGREIADPKDLLGIPNEEAGKEAPQYVQELLGGI